MSNDSDDEKVGFGRPPKKHQFKKGQTGNVRGRPRKVAPPVPVVDPREILRRIDREEVSVGGQIMTRFELDLRVLAAKATKGDLAASKELNRRREALDLNKPTNRGGGVLVVPGTAPLDEWEAAAARQQAQFRGPEYSEAAQLEAEKERNKDKEKDD